MEQDYIAQHLPYRLLPITRTMEYLDNEQSYLA